MPNIQKSVTADGSIVLRTIKFKIMKSIHVDEDGFVWELVDHKFAIKNWSKGETAMFTIWGDGSQSMIETEEDLKRTVEFYNLPIGEEAGWIKDVHQNYRLQLALLNLLDNNIDAYMYDNNIRIYVGDDSVEISENEIEYQYMTYLERFK